MSIFLDEHSKIIVQGITGGEGTKHTKRMLASGAQVVGGVNARKAGTKVDFDGTVLPVFASVAEAMAETGANVTVGFVPPAFTKDSVIEAIDAEIPLAVVITEGVAVHDSAAFWAHAQGKSTRIIGPNCLGILNTDADVRLNATFGDLRATPGPLAVGSQSGAGGIALLADAARAGLGQPLGVPDRQVLDAAIGVMDQAPEVIRAPVPDGHLEGVQGQVGELPVDLN